MWKTERRKIVSPGSWLHRRWEVKADSRRLPGKTGGLVTLFSTLDKNNHLYKYSMFIMMWSLLPS